ncbi:probable inactive purple acid phosphatase 28 isoform X1 [Telopea speciosissima]|uniref:probable inactive purple acid phosphatase 28 isoform X1 n=1 Tax=Telopea speciosissima TaxID=54955 RepID=UPI001CC758D3|nr:probable inactive purple acid phosphatase 28 isoform X1 [Telopea speciosissima]
MEGSAREKWLTLPFFIAFLFAVLYLLQTLILENLMVGNTEAKIKRKPDLPLRFNSNGTFKILQVADMHYGNGIVTRCRDVLPSEFEFCSDLNTTQFLRRVIKAEKPDLIVFTGDNIFGPSAADAAESLAKAVSPALESRIPWAAILGNHDQESTMSREELMSFISLMDYSVSQINPSMSDSADGVETSTVAIDGFGNYNLRVQGAFGSDLANTSILNLLFLDSGDRATVNGVRTYGWIKESQLHWLRSFSEGLKQGNEWDREPLYGITLAPTPALAFFHIPIPEIRQLWYKKIVGQYQEGVACSVVNSGVLPALVSMGDVKAVFIGHDHTNDFCGELDGIWFCYGGGFGYHAYGKAGWSRRARIILAELGRGEKAWMGVERIKTWKCLDDENLSKIDEQILWH